MKKKKQNKTQKLLRRVEKAINGTGLTLVSNGPDSYYVECYGRYGDGNSIESALRHLLKD